MNTPKISTKYLIICEICNLELIISSFCYENKNIIVGTFRNYCKKAYPCSNGSYRAQTNTMSHVLFCF